MRILITGAGGLLGGRLCTLLAVHHETTGLIRKQNAPEGIASLSCDLVDPEAVGAALRETRPAAVIHCAALADPEICESRPELARRENETATRTLARACEREGVRLIAISTDLVLRGNAAFSTEAAHPDPVSEYGRSKLRAEMAATEECPLCVILRVALVVGRGHGSRLTASEALVTRVRRGETVHLFEDEWRTPIDPASVAQAVHNTLLRPSATGVFHIGGSERITRVEIGERLATILGISGPTIRRVPQSSHQGAPRPHDVSLGCRRAHEELEWTPRPLDLALREGRNG